MAKQLCGINHEVPNNKQNVLSSDGLKTAFSRLGRERMTCNVSPFSHTIENKRNAAKFKDFLARLTQGMKLSRLEGGLKVSTTYFWLLLEFVPQLREIGKYIRCVLGDVVILHGKDRIPLFQDGFSTLL